MDKEKSQILVLVEGNKTDYNLMNKLLEVYGISDSQHLHPIPRDVSRGRPRLC